MCRTNLVKASLDNARERCQWLALATSLLILLSTLSLTFTWPSESRAFSQPSDANLFSLPGNYGSPHRCRECHAEEYQAWSNTTHAQASFDPIFQVSLQQVAEPGECFSCHTTGYNSNTGQFVLSGVTCEACHGPYRPEHPKESMTVAASEELCGTCHTGTSAEWASSHHRRVGVTCADCHEVHTQKTRSFESTNVLCAGCHRDQIQDATHTAHRHSESGIHCIDCHLARPSDGVDAMVKGQMATGHSFAVIVSTCDDCHLLPLPTDVESP
jgi:hypothetical protein